jgi:acyl-CoA synthetase (AMP-forming)/AMP-acid ligase II/pimeloyl-ACP methyl ester carboxylesterase
MVTSASLPTRQFPGFDRAHSALLSVPGVGLDSGRNRVWHYQDTADALERDGIESVGTILAIHGNPTWSYLWRSVIARSIEIARAGGPAWRVVAVDQLEMGWSERTDVTRTLQQRIADLGAFTDALALDGPVVTLGHDWGGVISLGWATAHPELLSGVALTNTAVHHPDGVSIPAPLRLAGARGVLQGGSVYTTAFLDTTLSLASPRLTPDVRAAYRSPYAHASRRRGIGAFVADIPVGVEHESFARLEQLSADVAELTVPTLMLWGPKDPIFSDRYLNDLIDRLPHARVHRFEGAGHLVVDDAPVADAVLDWLKDSATPAHGTQAMERDPYVPLWQRLTDRRDESSPAVVEPARRNSGTVRRVSWKQLDDRISRLAAGLHDLGVRSGDRVSLLITPGATLTAVVYACLRIGAVVVVADAGLGVRGLGRAVTGAWPAFIIGETKALIAARAMRWPGVRISTVPLPAASAATLGVTANLRALLATGDTIDLPAEPDPDSPAAILFTSGSTGPAKGVVYTHRQLAAVRDALESTLNLTPHSGLVTGFAPFALLGPALGARSSTPAMDISSPRTLTASAVAAAVATANADVLFLSPASILNVVATSSSLGPSERETLGRVRTVLSTGAPVGERLMTSLIEILPNATAHAIYGMTECLLVSDITLDEVRAVGSRDDGVCVGRPIAGVEILISPLDARGKSSGDPSNASGVLGEIVISAPHLKLGYDRLWYTDREALRETPPSRRWHRTGDVGHLDEDGRLWIEGRLAHVIVTQDGPVAPVGLEQAVESVPDVRRAAIVGVGPEGLRQFVAVVETIRRARHAGLASESLAGHVRAASPRPLVAVLSVPALPTDIRHNSKIDRSRLSEWAESTLSGRRPTAP